MRIATFIARLAPRPHSAARVIATVVATGGLLAACATSPRAATPPDRAPAPPAADTARRDTTVALSQLD